MGIKALLRDWLGITKLECELEAAALKKAEDKVDDRALLREEIANALEVVLAGDRQGKHYPVWCAIIPDQGRRFEQILRRVTADAAATVASSEVERRIGTELFIDEVVKRIQRKQLNGSQP